MMSEEETPMARNKLPDTITTLESAAGSVQYYSLPSLARELGVDLTRMPFTVKILLENVLRLHAQDEANADEVERLARWEPSGKQKGEFPFLPARVLLQDF